MAKLPDGKMKEKGQEALDQITGFKTMANMGMVTGFLALVFLILTFIKKAKPQLILGGLMSVISVVAIIISPSFDTGPHGGLDAKTQAMIWGIAAILATVFGVLAEKKRQSA